jgi:hypothetical protein
MSTRTQATDIRDIHPTLWGFDDPALRLYCYAIDSSLKFCLGCKVGYRIIGRYETFEELLDSATISALLDP